MTKTSNEIEIKPSVLKEIRESSGYTLEEVARKLKANATMLKEAEEKPISFKLSQIEKLADLFSRPLVAFFSDVIPKPISLPDYRINRDKKLTKEVYLAERKANYLSVKLSEISGKKSVLPELAENISADEMAKQFKKNLDIKTIKSLKPADTLEQYKRLLEEKLVIAIIEYPLKANDVRAFSISADVSVIVLNESDKPEIKLFSLFHELCHLLKKKSGICSIAIDEESQEIERFCDSFSAEALLPEDEFKKDASNSKTGTLNELSKLYSVSKQVIMLKLFKLKFIKLEQYNDFKRRFSNEKLKAGFGRRKWEKVFFNRVGNMAIREVGNAYKSGRISSSEVIDILNMKTKYIEKFIESA